MSTTIESLDASIRARALKKADKEVTDAFNPAHRLCDDYHHLKLEIDRPGNARIDRDGEGKVIAVYCTVRHAMDLLRTHALAHIGPERAGDAVANFVRQVDGLMEQLDERVGE